jgi:hypothetical protein
MQATIVLTLRREVGNPAAFAESAAAHLVETFEGDVAVIDYACVAGGPLDLTCEEVQLAVQAIEAAALRLPAGTTAAARLQGIADDLLLWALGLTGSAA